MSPQTPARPASRGALLGWRQQRFAFFETKAWRGGMEKGCGQRARTGTGDGGGGADTWRSRGGDGGLPLSVASGKHEPAKD